MSLRDNALGKTNRLAKNVFPPYCCCMPQIRYTPQNRESLCKTAKAMKENALLLEVIAASMEDEKFDELQVTNYDQLRRGMEFLDNFCAAARAALRQARIERGDHHAPINGKPNKKPS